MWASNEFIELFRNLFEQLSLKKNNLFKYKANNFTCQLNSAISIVQCNACDSYAVPQQDATDEANGKIWRGNIYILLKLNKIQWKRSNWKR